MESSLTGEGAERISRLLQSGTVVWKNSKFSLHPNTQIGESVPLNDSNKLTLTDNQSALLGINSSELSASKDNGNLSDVQENSEENRRQELFESGRRALLSADSETLRQIDMDVDLAAERVRRLQESGNADAEALAAAQEMLSLAEVRARGVRSGLQEMIEAQQRAIAEELEPMKSERGMIVPVTFMMADKDL